jgi:hypothetical protein
VSQTFPFTYADKKYTASFITMKQSTSIEFHITISDEQLIKEFRESHIVTVLHDKKNKWIFGFEGAPFGSGQTFMTGLALGLRKFAEENSLL